MGTLWNFNLLHGHGTLLLIPFPSTLTSLRLTGQLPSFQKEHCCRVFWLFEIVWFHTLQYSNHPRWVCQIFRCHLHSAQKSILGQTYHFCMYGCQASSGLPIAIGNSILQVLNASPSSTSLLFSPSRPLLMCMGPQLCPLFWQAWICAEVCH